jgi:hypothetical protein
MRRLRLILLASIATLLSQPAHAGTTAPPSPITDNPTAIGCHSAELSWSGVEDFESGLANYRIWRNGQPVATTHGTPQSRPSGKRLFVVENLEPGGSYNFSVSAIDLNGNESDATEFGSIQLPAGIPECSDSKPPSAPQDLSVAQSIPRGCGALQINIGTLATDNLEVGSYQLYRNGTLVSKSDTRGDVSDQRIQDNGYGSLADAEHAYQVSAMDTAGNESPLSETLTVKHDCRYWPILSEKANGIHVGVYGVTFSDYPTALSPFLDVSQSVFKYVYKGGPNMGEPVGPSLEHYLEEISFGRLSLNQTFSTNGWVHLDKPRSEYCTLSSGGTNWRACESSRIMNDVHEVLGTPRPDDVDINLLFLAGTGESVGGGGIANIRGDYPVKDSLPDITHEFLHTLNLVHASQWWCRGYTNDTNDAGYDVEDPGFGCFLGRYGDPYNVMGSANIFHISMYFKMQLGLVDRENVVFSQLLGDGSYELTAVERPAESGEKHLLLIPLNPEKPELPPFYSVEYRTPTGYNGEWGQQWGDRTASTDPINGVIVRLIPHKFVGVDGDELFVKALTADNPVFQDTYTGIRIELTATGDLQTPSVVNVSRNCNTSRSFARALAPGKQIKGTNRSGRKSVAPGQLLAKAISCN